MAVKQRIGRAVVRSNPALIFRADEACQIVLYALSKRADGTDNPEIVVQVGEEPTIPYGDENSAVLPFDKGFPIFLEEDQELWAISPGEAEVTFTVLPAPLSVIGY